MDEYPTECTIPELKELEYHGQYGFHTLYEAVEKAVREAFKSEKPFDTGYMSIHKEFESGRIQFDGTKLKLTASAYMDEWPDIVYDCENGDDLTQDEVDLLESMSNEIGFVTETEDIREIDMTTFELAMDKLQEMVESCEQYLQDQFASLQNLVNAVIEERTQKKEA